MTPWLTQLGELVALAVMILVVFLVVWGFEKP